MTRPDTAQPDDEQPVTSTPAERIGDDADADSDTKSDTNSDSDSDEFALGQDDDLRAGQLGPDPTRP